jgi:hypothetical protein
LAWFTDDWCTVPVPLPDAAAPSAGTAKLTIAQAPSASTER